MEQLNLAIERKRKSDNYKKGIPIIITQNIIINQGPIKGKEFYQKSIFKNKFIHFYKSFYIPIRFEEREIV